MNIILNTMMNIAGIASIVIISWFVAFWLFSAILYAISWIYARKGKFLDISGYGMIGYLAVIVLILSIVAGVVFKSIFLAVLSLIIGLVVLFYTKELWVIDILKNVNKGEPQ